MSHDVWMCVRYYLPLQQETIAKIVYNGLIRNKNPSYRKHDLASPEYIHKEVNLEYLCNISINIATKILRNKPHLTI